MRYVAPLLLLLISAVPSAADWPLFRGDALMSGVAPANPAPFPDQLDEKWTFKTGDSIEAAPIIAKGVVYVGSFDKHFYAIDLATGKEKWKTKLGHIKASAAARGDKIYIGNLNGDFFCLNAADGKQLWKFETGGEIASGCNFHGDNILIGSHDSTLYCLDPQGKKLWEVKTDGPVNGSPVVVGDTTFVAGCDSVLHVLDARTGKELGTVDLGGQAAATAAVHGDFAYVGTMANTVIGLDWKNKKKLWSFENPKRSQPFYASAAVTESLVIAGSRDQRVYALDRKTGNEVWSVETAGMVDGSPVVVGNRVYVGCLSKDGEFYVLDLKTGKKLQELNLDSAVVGSLAVGPDCILVGTDKGRLYCLGAKAK
jgi:outer membrane protein assembly factor BamB